MAEESVLVETTIAAPIESVWRALRDPALIRLWFGWDSESLIEEIDFIFAKSGMEGVPGRRLDFGEWEGAADSFVLTEAGAGTTLTVLRTGKAITPAAYDEVVEGWISFVAQLRLMLEQHADPRRTLYLSGNARPNAGALSDALGLAQLSDAPLGMGYTANLAPGESVSGKIWHRSTFQIGLTVRQWGDGLLIVANRPVAESRPAGGGYLILSTYGLGDTEFADLEKRWRDWWSQSFLTR